MRARLLFTSLTLAVACAACTQRESHDTVAAPNTSASPSTAIPPPAVATTVPPAVATPASPSTVALEPAGVMPASDAIDFLGFGPAHWGASEEQVRQAWGKDMEAMPKEPEGCHYLFPEPQRAGGYRFAFMIDEGKFGRIDVRTADFAAPGGGKVGMDKAELQRLYPGMAAQPGKYDPKALTLRSADPKGGPAAVVFEVDPSGKATAWRIGVPPQVDYVEGCS